MCLDWIHPSFESSLLILSPYFHQGASAPSQQHDHRPFSAPSSPSCVSDLFDELEYIDSLDIVSYEPPLPLVPFVPIAFAGVLGASANKRR
jgi:hypothetical protein